MSKIIFSPWPHPGERRAPGSAEVVYLRRALLVLRGTFFNPVLGREAPLPRHRWVLVHSGEVFSEGNDSDANGISTIFEPARQGVGPEDTWHLMLIPVYEGHADSDDYAEHQEALLDVDTGKWVPGSDVRVPGRRPYQRLSAAARLLRIPLWTTRAKAASGGGFQQTNPHSVDFDTKGELKTSELKAHGTPSAPWTLQVDHGWFRSHLQFRSYDYKAKVDTTVPQGLMVQARDPLDAAVLGVSSVLLDDGSLYMLSARSKDGLKRLIYMFETDAFALIRFESRQLVRTSVFEKSLLADHRVLPTVWGSRGQSAWLGTENPTPSSRKKFKELRLAGEVRSRPLCFHLDDVAATMDDLKPVGVLGRRVTIFDHFLRIRDPAGPKDEPLPYSKYAVLGFPLPAEDAFFDRGEGIDRVTCAIEYEGRMFVVDEQHVPGDPLLHLMVGCRAAHPAAMSIEHEHHEILVIDTSYLRFAHKGTIAAVVHLMVYVTTFLECPSEDDEQPSGKNEARSLGLPVLERSIARASVVWDQRHVAHGNDNLSKDFVIVPERGLRAGDAIIKIRHHFGIRPDSPRVRVSSAGGPLDTRNHIMLHPQAGRATAGSVMHLYLVLENTILAPPVPVHPPAPRPYHFEPVGQVFDRFDQASEIRSATVHELGHWMGLPDEYIETERPNQELPGRLPGFEQSSLGKPYALARTAMMNENCFPRLRYVWHFMGGMVRLLESHRGALARDHWYLRGAPFVSEYVGPAPTVLRFEVPVQEAGEDVDLWVPRQAPLGLGQAYLYRLGADEDTMGPILTPSRSGLLAEHFDGIIVVHTNYWFTFDTSISRLKKRWKIMTKFGLPLLDRRKIPHFYIEAPTGSPDFKRVAILFQPRFELEGVTERSETEADVEVVVRGNKGRKLNTTVVGSRGRARIRDRDVGRWLIRFALQPMRWRTKVDNSKIEADDLGPVNTWLATLLGRGEGTIRSFA